MTTIPLLEPTFPSPHFVLDDYEAIVKNGIFSNGGPFERAFARALADSIGFGVKAVPLASGTAGLEIAMRVCFVSSREKVLIASFTFPAGPLAVRRSGFEPVFMDIDVGSWQPALADADSYLDSHPANVAGILLTNTFGVANDDIGAWEDLSTRFGVPLVIDSAAGFGSRYEWGEPLGARGAAEVFSFHATKVLAIGEGGAITARDPDDTEKMGQMINFGFDVERLVTCLGTNAKLAELPSAIGIRQLSALPDRLAARQEILEWYRDGLGPLGFTFQLGSERAALPFVSALAPSSRTRDDFRRRLEAHDIETRCYYNPPVHLQPVFDPSETVGDLQVTDEMASRVISLPMRDHLRAGDVEKIVGIARECVRL